MVTLDGPFGLTQATNIVLVIGIYLVYFSNVFAFVCVHEVLTCHGPLSSLIVFFYEINLFQRFLLIFKIICHREKCHVHRLWWKELRQKTYLHVGYKLFKVYQNFVTTSFFFFLLT